MTRRKKETQKTLSARETLGKKGQWVKNEDGLKGTLMADVKRKCDVVTVMHVDGVPRTYVQHQLRVCRRPHRRPVRQQTMYAIT